MNHWLNGAWATCSFELRRSFTFQRTAVSVVLALFPPVMLSLIIFSIKVANRGSGALSMFQEASTFAIVLLVAIVCLLSLLLWATPNVSSELEGKSWSFIASRPGGRVSVLLGKFLASFFVSFGISLVAITLCVLLTDRLLGGVDSVRQWAALSGVYMLGCMVYSAIFSLFGTLFIKRSMVVAAGYLIGSDVVLAFIPGALINKLTIRFHLQEIGLNWIGWFVPIPENDYRIAYGEAWPIWLHVSVILMVVLSTLAFGAWVVVNREYITADDT